jgi:O-antigen/teichoic acid export membrane protein
MSISTVMFSAFSRKQDSRKELHSLFKKTINVNSYLLFMVLGIFAIAAPSFISVVLTDKWLPMVPYVWIACCTCVFHPAATAQLQALAAIGRSDLRLKMEFLKKTVVIVLLVPAIPYGPIAIAISAAISTLIAMFIGAVACQRYVGYSIWSTVKDILPIMVVTFLTLIPLYFVGKMGISPIWKLLLQSSLGIIIYIALSALFSLYGFNYLKDFVLSKLRNRINSNL